MGVGYVSPGQVPPERQGNDLPRRQRRGAGAPGALALTDRGTVGRWGESLAALFLSGYGLEILGQNVALAGGEIDLVCRDGKEMVVVEVRTRLTSGDPIDAVGAAKRRQVSKLARQMRANRVDLIGVGIHTSGITIHWVPDASLS